MDHLEAIVGIFLGAIGVVTSVGGGLAWYRARVSQDVEKKRDFNHLKNNYRQLAESLKDIVNDQEANFEHLRRQMDRIEIRLDPDKTIPHFKSPQRHP
jgi:hypothetical protein